jgi:hypothetical protein
MTKPAVSEATLSLLGGLMTLKVAVLPAKMAEERIDLKLICPDTDDPTRPVQMYVHPDDVGGDKPRMWTTGECDRAREVDGILYRVDADEVKEAKTPLLPTGEMSISVFPAEQVTSVSRPGGALYRLRPTAAPHVYAMLVDLVGQDVDHAFMCELAMRSSQRFYRLEAWNGALVLTEYVRPGEFNPAEDYTADYPAELLTKAQAAIGAQVEEFDPEQYVSFLRDRAKELDDVKRDPKAKAAQRKAAPKPKIDDTDALMALLDGVAATAKPKGRTRKAS